jgi:hypothetical protein
LIGIIPLIGWLVLIMLSPPTANDTRIPYGPDPKAVPGEAAAVA